MVLKAEGDCIKCYLLISVAYLCSEFLFHLILSAGKG